MMIRTFIAGLFARPQDKVAAASAWIDADRVKRIAADAAARSERTRKGNATRKARAAL